MMDDGDGIVTLGERLNKMEAKIDHLEARMENMDVALFQDRRRYRNGYAEIDGRVTDLTNRFDDARSHEHQLIRSHEKQLAVAGRLLDRAMSVINGAQSWGLQGVKAHEWRQKAITWKDSYHEYLQRVTAVEETDAGGYCQICEEDHGNQPPTDADYDSIEDWDR